jgi:hypothetical protein
MKRLAVLVDRIHSIVRVSFFVGAAVAGIPSRAEAQNLVQPGKPHELLAREAGTWDCDIKMFFRGPAAPPAEFKGVEVNELVSGGLYLRTSFNYPMGNRGEFEGHALIGYDPRSKKYVGTWVDNHTTVPSQVQGEYDENSKTMTDRRTVVGGGGNEFKSKQVTTWLDDSNKKLEIFIIVEADGKDTEIKLMEMTATKRE